MRKIDWKYIIITILLVAAFIVSGKYAVQLKSWVKYILTLPDLGWYAGGISVITTILHKIKTGKIKFDSGMSFKDFRTSINDVISFIDNPIIIVGALALAKGLFLHYTENVQFSPFLNKNEIVLILLVTAYLLYISLFELWNTIVAIFRIEASQNKTQVTPVNVTSDTEVPKPQH